MSLWQYNLYKLKSIIQVQTYYLIKLQNKIILLVLFLKKEK